MPEEKQCIVCSRKVTEVPLIRLEFGEQLFYICPQDLPVVIHQPHKLIGKLPGADKLEAHA